MSVELTCYRTPTGRLMALCECRMKVRVLKDGALASHQAYDRDLADEDCPEGTCLHSGKELVMSDGEVFGLEYGTLRER